MPHSSGRGCGAGRWCSRARGGRGAGGIRFRGGVAVACGFGACGPAGCGCGCGCGRRCWGRRSRRCRAGRGGNRVWRRWGCGATRYGNGCHLQRRHGIGGGLGWSEVNLGGAWRGGGYAWAGRGCRGLHGIVRHNPRLLCAGNNQHMLPYGKRRFAGLGDRDQLAAGFLDDIFPTLGIRHGLRGCRAANAPNQCAGDCAQRGAHGAGGKLRTGNTASSATAGRPYRAIGAYCHLPDADNHPALHVSLFLRGIGGIGIGGVALFAP